MEKENTKQLNIADSVMKEIDAGHVKMRPKIYFVLGMLALGIGLTSTMLLGVWFVGLTSYHFRHHDPLSFVAFGQHGWIAFLRTFPFIPLLLALAAIGIGIWLIRKYEVSYKHSFLGIAVAAVVAVVVTGYVIDELGVNERLATMPPMRMWYADKSVGEEWLICEVKQVFPEDKQLICETPNNDVVKVQWDDTTFLPFGADFKEEDVIRSVGVWEDDVFKASGIKKGYRIPMRYMDAKRPSPTGVTKGWRFTPPYR